MSVALRTQLTLAQFPSWGKSQEQRHEFDGRAPIVRAGGTAANSAIQRNLIFSLTGHLRGSVCQRRHP